MLMVKVTPGQKKLYILAKILNVSEAWLLGYDVERARIDDKSRAEFNQQQDTMAAHFDKDGLTEEEMKEVQDFIKFIKSKKKLKGCIEWGYLKNCVLKRLDRNRRN